MRVGLTGVFGAGKSMVAQLMARSSKVVVIDADVITHELLEPSTKCYKKVAKLFPGAILTSGRLDRRELAAQVFSNPRRLKQLTDILHPEAFKRVKKLIAQYKKTKKIIIIEAPLLFEAKWDSITDVNIVVWADKKKIIARLVKKGFKQQDFNKRMKFQWSQTQKKQRADILINNSGNQQETCQQVQMIMRRLERRTH